MIEISSAAILLTEQNQEVKAASCVFLTRLCEESYESYKALRDYTGEMYDVISLYFNSN